MKILVTIEFDNRPARLVGFDSLDDALRVLEITGIHKDETVEYVIAEEIGTDRWWHLLADHCLEWEEAILAKDARSVQ